MKYKFSNFERIRVKNGRQTTVAFCDVCGKQHKNNFGFEIGYERDESFCRSRMKLCGKCADQIVPILERAIEECYNMKQMLMP